MLCYPHLPNEEIRCIKQASSTTCLSKFFISSFHAKKKRGGYKGRKKWMFSRFEGWDLENIGVWQSEENKSKEQRKCQSSFRPETWPSSLHINVMKLSLSVRSLEEGENPSPQNQEGAGESVEGDSKQHLQVAAEGESSGSQLLPKLHSNSADIAMSSNQSHLN